MELNSANIYPCMREHYFLQLPSVPYAVYDETKTFDLAKREAHNISNPKPLSASELLFVADGYPHDPIEYKHAVEIIANPYPENRIDNIQTLSVALSANDMTGSTPYRSDLIGNPDCGITWGGYTIDYDYESAQQDFQKAINTGNAEAICNLQELNRRRDAFRLLID